MTLIVPDRESLNLLGYFLERILIENCSKKAKSIFHYPAKIYIQGAKMGVWLLIGKGEIRLMPFTHEDVPDISVFATLNTFLDIAIGKSIVFSFLSGKIKIKGNPLKILPHLRWIILKLS